MDQEVVLRADPLLTYSINTQIKEQIKWLIGIGKIRPGEMLPPAQQLADTLHVNRNTVNLVYTQLRDEGIVSMQKGRGTQVLANDKVEALQKARPLLFRLLENMLRETEAQHLDIPDLSTACMAFLQLFGRKPNLRPKLLFIECKEHDHLFYCNEISKYTGAEITTVFLEDLVSGKETLEEQLQGCDAVITTLNHGDEVKQRLGAKKKLVTIGASIDFALLLDIAKLAPGTKVGFVCLGRMGGQWMAQKAREAGIDHILASPAGTNDKESLFEILEHSDKVFASTAVYEEVSKLAPDKVAHLPLSLEKSSERLLSEYASVNPSIV